MRTSRFSLEVLLGRALLAFTVVATAFLVNDLLSELLALIRAEEYGRSLQQLAFCSIIAAMLYGNLVYQVARLGHFKRQQQHDPADHDTLLARYATSSAPLAILVPSYREERHVVRQTLLSAALQDYPNRRVVLLIDDPPQSDDAGAIELLEKARRLPREVADLLEKPASRFEAALEEFRGRSSQDALDFLDETRHLAELHAEAAAWFESQAANEPCADHTDRHFIELVLRRSAGTHFERTVALSERAADGNPLTPSELLKEHLGLAARFRAEITSFERKRYTNLSHEPNKAMNLNSYIGLLGGSFREVERDGQIHLEPADSGEPDLAVPAADFLITLDADSLLAPDYALRLIDVLEQPGKERVAVAQTPYSAIPGASGELERIAGATTDIQYIIHQGFTNHHATYWVGANAVLRKVALDDLQVVDHERGFEIHRYIQDNTVIEDTESSVDLIDRGWTLYNYSERLAYSATPPDFGALVIQRGRWANGGLLILPKLLRHLRLGSWSPKRLAEASMRVHYLASIACVNLGLLMLLLFPFEHSLRVFWLPLTALPYFALYGRDLIQIGYRPGDFARAYALNLLLLPVNLAGVWSSLRQAASGEKSSFARTPKVADRTTVPAGYIVVLCVLLTAMSGLFVADLMQQRWLHATFAFVNGSLLAYAMLRFIGVREGLEDLGLLAET